MKKILKRLLQLFLVVFGFAVIAGSVITVKGYMLYQEVTEQTSVETKVADIQSDKSYTKLKHINKDFSNAVVATEDKRFYTHNGFDFVATSRAVATNIANFDLVEGGSTITQQLAKNMYFKSDDSFVRKIAELFIAWELEGSYAKDEILELYVNTIYYGDDYYGVFNASKGYFHKKPSALNLSEATLLAGLPQAPSTYALSTGYPLAKQRQKQVVNAMVDQGMLTQEQARSIIGSE